MEATSPASTAHLLPVLHLLYTIVSLMATYCYPWFCEIVSQKESFTHYFSIWEFHFLLLLFFFLVICTASSHSKYINLLSCNIYQVTFVPLCILTLNVEGFGHSKSLRFLYNQINLSFCGLTLVSWEERHATFQDYQYFYDFFLKNPEIFN